MYKRFKVISMRYILTKISNDFTYALKCVVEPSALQNTIFNKIKHPHTYSCRLKIFPRKLNSDNLFEILPNKFVHCAIDNAVTNNVIW